MDLSSILKFFDDESVFVPFYNQIPIIKWAENKLYKKDLYKYNFDCLGLFLGNTYISLDCDGFSSINFLKSLENILGELPKTYYISSNPGKRGAYIFKIKYPIKYLSINTGIGERLEFRSGNLCQNIFGRHKSGKDYKIIPNEIADFPKEWIDYLNQDFIFLNENQIKVWDLLQKIKNENPLYGIEYDYWIKIGMILHQISSNESEEIAEQYLRMWISWSRSFEGYEDEPENNYIIKWKSFKNKKNSLGFGSLFYFAGINKSPRLQEFIDYSYEYLLNKLKLKIKDFAYKAFSSAELPAIAENICNQIFGYSNNNLIKYAINELESIHISKDDLNQIIKFLYKEDQSALNFDLILKNLPIKKSLLEYSMQYNIPKEFLLIAFICAYSSCLSKKLKFKFNLKSITIPNLFLIFIGEPTSGKSEIIRPFLNVLQTLSIESISEYLKKKRSYEEFLEEWRRLNDNQKNDLFNQKLLNISLDDSIDINNLFFYQKRDLIYPEPKLDNLYLISDATFESIKKLSGICKKFGLLIAPEDLIAFLDSLSYGNKKLSNATDRLLAIWNGEATTRMRISTDLEEPDHFQISMLSGLQYDHFNNIFDLSDPSGFLSRCILIPIKNFINIPSRIDLDDENKLERDFLDLIIKSQKELDFDHPHIIKNTEDSLELWGSWRDEIEKEAEKIFEKSKGFGQWLRRFPINIARIALILNTLHYISGNADINFIKEDIMASAIHLGNWLKIQAQSAFNVFFMEEASIIEDEKIIFFKNLIEFCKGSPRKISEIRMASFARRKNFLEFYGDSRKSYPKKSEIIDFLKDAESFGIGEITEELFIPKSKQELDYE